MRKLQSDEISPQIECGTGDELDQAVDKAAGWAPNDREDTWRCPGVTVIKADSLYTQGESPAEVRYSFSTKKYAPDPGTIIFDMHGERLLGVLTADRLRAAGYKVKYAPDQERGHGRFAGPGHGASSVPAGRAMTTTSPEDQNPVSKIAGLDPYQTFEEAATAVDTIERYLKRRAKEAAEKAAKAAKDVKP